MANKLHTPAQLWQEIDFANRLTDTSSWIRMADELADAANILEAEAVQYWSEIRIDEHQHPVHSTNRKYVQGAYFLLIAYVLENYFKALLIYQNQKDLKGLLLTKLSRYLKHHDLGMLADEAKFRLDTSEEELLFRLSRSSIWAARYPIPIESEALANMKKFSNGQSYLITYYAPQDIKRIHNFIGRLRNYVLSEVGNNA
jgi:hypothetical protein